MFNKLIITIAITSILQAVINIIAPENHARSIIISATNIIFSSAIFLEIFAIITNVLKL